LGEEGDYLIRTCGDEDFAKRVQTESEQGPSRAAVCSDGNGMQARPRDAGFHRQRHGECQERKQRAQFFRVGQVRSLQREALGFEISEHGFDGPALAMMRERMMRPAKTGQCQQLA